MTKALLPSLLLIAIACAPSDPEPDTRPITVMTYNVLCNFCVFPEHDSWDERVPFHLQIVEEHAPDLIGLQELFLFEDVALYTDRFPEYEALFYIDDGDGLFETYADATLLYRSERFEEVDHGFFWLSDTPDEPFSKGFAEGAQLPRLVAWAKLRQRTDGRELLFATTHVDNNQPSQELSAPLFAERLLPLAGEDPILLVGDFNSKPPTEAYGIWAETFTNTFDQVTDPVVLNNEDPPIDYVFEDRIDHIWTFPELTTNAWTVDTRAFGDNGNYPSDHFPMIADIALP
jgi:endonuclease/exonuclease/phosphatase family metal-dependent hydrolase